MTQRLGNAATVAQMGCAERIQAFKVTSTTPGPGQYVAPSAFGYYVSKNSADLERVKSHIRSQSADFTKGLGTKTARIITK